MLPKMKTIRSKNHQLGSFELNKVSLSCFDDQRYILKDGIQTYAYRQKYTIINAVQFTMSVTIVGFVYHSTPSITVCVGADFPNKLHSKKNLIKSTALVTAPLTLGIFRCSPGCLLGLKGGS